MTTLLDAHALVAFLAGEPALAEVQSLLRAGDTAIPSINLAEAVDVVERVYGIADKDVRAAVSALTAGPLEVLPCREAEAWRAAELRTKHYARRRTEVSIPDCFLVASARPSDTVASSDRGVLTMSRREGIAALPLLDSRGRRPR